ncbi:hypothetical protein RISK_001658 [Rhodopirellula islandica]|uniref:Uncharacterized protein n=1 Tax=Rhodopirellula islandica TaxID=595434 RepID=A0A0J1BIU1_RHOIS|nr:hypothetical protein RISK_001658 [Rhodopirellula islandica]
MEEGSMRKEPIRWDEKMRSTDEIRPGGGVMPDDRHHIQ